VKPLVLASGSPRRRALLEALGAAVDVRVSAVAEITGGAPAQTAAENARRKRDAVVATVHRETIVVAADTIVVVEGRILNKPADLDEARGMLRTLAGRTHEVMTGLAVTDTATGSAADAVEVTRVTFRDLSAPEIDRFVDAVRPLDRAGAYTVEGPGSLLVARYEGCYTNVLGLPLVGLDELLRTIGDGLFARIDAARARFL
jgi:septum formation protein